MDETAGYLSGMYAVSLLEFGIPVGLPLSGCQVLQREIPGTGYWDAMGCYPLFCCADWSQLNSDLHLLEDGSLVSLVVVTDPFGEYDQALLRRCFPDLVVKFKEHYVIDLSRDPGQFVSKHHQRYAKRALAELDVDIPRYPEQVLDDWCRLYDVLIERHKLIGVHAFSRRAFGLQLRAPGMVVFVARKGGVPIAMLLWYVQGDVVYYHLGASDHVGYAHRASFGLFSVAIEHFREMGLSWLALGAGAGPRVVSDDPLSQFKQGWATGTKPAYLCGRVLDVDSYGMLTAQSDNVGYFPVYRAGEFSSLG